MLHQATSYQPDTTKQGYTLIEVLVVIVLLSLLIIPFIAALNNLNRHFTNLTTVAKGQYLSQRNLEITANLTQYNWQSVLQLTEEQPYFLDQATNGWQYLPGEQTTGPYTTSITFYAVCRDPQLEIVNCDSSTANTIDPNSLRAVSTTKWGQNQQIKNVTLEAIFTYLF